MFLRLAFVLSICCLVSCHDIKHQPETKYEIELMVLGTAQDAGYPQIACQKSCCKELNAHQEKGGKVVSLGLIDRLADMSFIFEATPDCIAQTAALAQRADDADQLPDAIFITHAHIGHYTGLMFLGKEAVDAQGVRLYSLPRFIQFIQKNGPWNQLVDRNNIQPLSLNVDTMFKLTEHIEIKLMEVPHRDEYSETAAYIIHGPNKSALFIPDIDKWSKWEVDINSLIETVDYAFLDATFYDAVEINNRNISEIPHPFIIESLEKFDTINDQEKAKVYFIHFNHTNPVWDQNSAAFKNVIAKGFNIAKEGMVFGL
ncbi:MAG: pyrroloquinoline quinone biosynthesis protein PqqB [Saprospiraceae bacterium]|nr:pyrroloquinoline quinone biosynthesis protein PqqB [Saprospiraceae bacterium]